MIMRKKWATEQKKGYNPKQRDLADIYIFSNSSFLLFPPSLPHKTHQVEKQLHNHVV